MRIPGPKKRKQVARGKTRKLTQHPHLNQEFRVGQSEHLLMVIALSKKNYELNGQNWSRKPRIVARHEQSGGKTEGESPGLTTLG